MTTGLDLKRAHSRSVKTAAMLCAATFIPYEALAAADEVVVSAQRREQSLQDAPAVINVLDLETLENLRVDNMENVVTYVPGLKLDGNDRTESRLGLRGAFSSTDTPGAGQSVGLYVDGVFLGRSPDLGPVLFDVERIEVLRGPQGTLFGRNVVGGLINIITRDPGDDFEAELRASYGRFNRFDFGGRISGPIIEDSLAASLSVLSRNSDGWQTNLVTGNKLDAEDTNSARLKFVWTPTETFTARLFADYLRDRTYGVTRNIVDADAERSPPLPKEQTRKAIDGGYDRDVWSVGLNASWDIGFATLESITAYRGLDSVTDGLDFVSDPVATIGITRGNEGETFSQELRLFGDTERLRWQTGVFFYNDNQFRSELDETVTAPGTTFVFFFGPGVVTDTFQDVNTKSYSIFGEATYEVAEWLNVTGGLRYTYDEKEIVAGASGDENPFLLSVPGGFVTSGSEDWDNVTPKVTVDMSWDDVGFLDSLLLYGTVSKGFKSGGFNSVTAPDELAPFDPEEAWNYEGGFKSTLLDGRATANVTVFFADYQDLQSLTQSGSSFATVNSDAKAKGVEADFTLSPVDGVDLSVGYAYLDTEIDDGVIIDGDDVGGNTLPQSPKHSVTTAINLTQPINDRLSFRLSGAYSYKSGVFFEPTNDRSSDPDILALSKFSILDLEGALVADRWELSVWGKNLFDDEPLLRALDLCTFGTLTLAERGAGEVCFDGVYDDPRTYGVTLKLKYN